MAVMQRLTSFLLTFMMAQVCVQALPGSGSASWSGLSLLGRFNYWFIHCNNAVKCSHAVATTGEKYEMTRIDLKY